MGFLVGFCNDEAIVAVTRGLSVSLDGGLLTWWTRAASSCRLAGARLKGMAPALSEPGHSMEQTAAWRLLQQVPGQVTPGHMNVARGAVMDAVPPPSKGTQWSAEFLLFVVIGAGLFFLYMLWSAVAPFLGGGDAQTPPIDQVIADTGDEDEEETVVGSSVGTRSAVGSAVGAKWPRAKGKAGKKKKGGYQKVDVDADEDDDVGLVSGRRGAPGKSKPKGKGKAQARTPPESPRLDPEDSGSATDEMELAPSPASSKGPRKGRR